METTKYYVLPHGKHEEVIKVSCEVIYRNERNPNIIKTKYLIIKACSVKKLSNFNELIKDMKCEEDETNKVFTYSNEHVKFSIEINPIEWTSFERFSEDLAREFMGTMIISGEPDNVDSFLKKVKRLCHFSEVNHIGTI